MQAKQRFRVVQKCETTFVRVFLADSEEDLQKAIARAVAVDSKPITFDSDQSESHSAWETVSTTPLPDPAVG